MAGATPESLLRQCRYSAVHLEQRDAYSLSDPVFLDWQAGNRHDGEPPESWWRPWHEAVSGAVQRGAVVRRARVVNEPLSPYIRYEYDIAFQNIAAGEEIRWLPRRTATDLLLPGNEFWLYDDELLLVTHFSGVGEVVLRETFTGSELIGRYRRAFRTVWERAVPHVDYRPE